MSVVTINPDGSQREESGQRSFPETDRHWSASQADWERLCLALDHGCDNKMHCQPNTVGCRNHAMLHDPKALGYLAFIAKFGGWYVMREFEVGRPTMLHEYRPGMEDAYREQVRAAEQRSYPWKSQA